MIPALSAIVASTGVVICLYVFLRTTQMLEDASSGGTKLVAAFTAVVALGAIFFIVLNAWDIMQAGAEVADAQNRVLELLDDLSG